ncbi:hypothetical protein LCGC14_1421900, partial [marine sediment metagenome]
FYGKHHTKKTKNRISASLKRIKEENRIKKENRACAFCNKSIIKRFVIFSNIEQDIKVHYFCNKACKFKWLNKIR